MASSNTQRRTRRGPSIGDVARLAEVSPQTVSRVSTGAPSVRPETRDKVIAAMNQLGYSPNKAARALRSGKFGTIGVLTQRLERIGESLTTAGVVEAASEKGYATTIVQVSDDPDDDSKTATRLLNLSVDGLIIIQLGLNRYETISLPPGMPVSVSDVRMVDYHPYVFADQIQGIRSAIEHLISLGHATVHHVAGASDSQPALVRTAAWRRYLTEAGIPTPPIWQGDWSAASGYQAGSKIARDPSITAVFCANDEMALGLVRALVEAGRRVPDDVSVVGFDDIGIAGYSIPPLTTIRQDFREIGRELALQIIGQIDGELSSDHRHISMPTELIIRGTTAPPPRPH